MNERHLDEDNLHHLIALAEESGIPDKRDAMFQGARLNVTAGRAATAVLAVGRESPIRVYAPNPARGYAAGGKV